MKKKIVGIIQSNFVPWQGYFDFINSCDEFILFDDIQYTERDWRNRNRLRTDQGVKWINVPVSFSRQAPTTIDTTPINHTTNWVKPLVDLMDHSYKRASFFEPYRTEVIEILSRSHSTISELNEELIRWVCLKLEIETRIVQARGYAAEGVKTDRLLDLLAKAEATAYISGPAAENYIEQDKFKSRGIELRYKVYDYKQYPQFHGEFIPGLSVLDLFFNTGKGAKTFLVSQVPDRVILRSEKGS